MEIHDARRCLLLAFLRNKLFIASVAVVFLIVKYSSFNIQRELNPNKGPHTRNLSSSIKPSTNDKTPFGTPRAIPFSTTTPHTKGQQCQVVETKSLRLDVDIRVIILTYNRPYAVLRLLNSLNRAIYGDSRVVIEIWIDRHLDKSYSEKTVSMAQEFYFEHGTCEIHIQVRHVGIQGQWRDTWRSYKSNEIAVLCEDDLTISPYTFTWLKLVREKYGNKADVSGFALQGFSVRHNDSHCCLKVPKENKVFLYTTLGTTGFSPNNKHWTDYKKWMRDIKRNKTHIDYTVPGHVTSRWYRFSQRTIWEMEYIHYTWKHNQFTLYSNFEGNRGLTFNWMDDGLHSIGMSKSAEDEKKGLVLDWKPEYEQLPAVPVYVNTNGEIIRPQKLH